MQIILTKEVPSLGGEGDVVKVAQGYATNYLIPNGLAVIATSGNLKQLEHKRESINKRRVALKAQAEEEKSKIHEKKVTIIAKAGEEGRLYGSITTKDMAAAIEKDLGLEVDRRRIEPNHPIKQIGDTTIKIRLYPEVEAKVLIKVESEESETDEDEETKTSAAAEPEETPDASEEQQPAEENEKKDE